MGRSLLIRPEARADLDEAYRWYEQQREGLGSDFLLCVEEALEKIRRTPELYPLVHKELRRMLIRRFPYGLFYLMEEEMIVLLAVFHARRDPKRWQSRA
ncbi:MAG: type II toxin-antitoxin system RelE/ParE family toxin [Planctomycetes bacterium]|nr:type II toxin-antitoxin system RelE/ParE family toxin [Planctomycetota bacterium]